MRWLLDALKRCWHRGLRFHDARIMRAGRADYYAYVRDVLDAQGGRRSLRDLFSDDAQRYGRGTPRGRLADQWERAFELSGGQLAHTWQGVFPDADIVLISIAQEEGATALGAALGDLAHTTRLIARLHRHVVSTVLAGVAACLVLIGVLFATAHVTVPRLKTIFAGVPEALWSVSTRRLFALSDALTHGLPLTLLALAMAVCWVRYAMPRAGGAWRKRADTWPIFQLYRDVHAIRFLSLLGLMVPDRPHQDTRLREALQALASGATPWMRAHMQVMLTRIEEGRRDSSVFDTGLLDGPLFWFMSDVIVARGLSEGLKHARRRTEIHLGQRVERQAQVLRWTLLLIAVTGVLGLALWHLQVIDALRRALSYALISN